MAIGNDNLWSGTYSTVKAFLEAQLTDPRRRYKSNWVHPGPVNISAKGFNGFPFVILQCDYADERLSLNIVTTNKEATIYMDIVSDDASEVDTWADELYNSLKTESNLTEIKAKKFWNWFTTVYKEFGEKFENKKIIQKLEDKISDMGKVSWEIGPGVVDTNNNGFVSISCG